MLINVDGVEYYIDVRGEGEPLVFLHGFTGDSTTWEKVSLLLSQSFQIIAVDIIGHGKTASPGDISRYTMSNVAKDIIVILNQLKINKAHILGYSMGGRLALSFAMLYPERILSLALESASPGLKTPDERRERIRQDEKLANMILDKGIEEFVNYWGQIPLFKSQERLPKSILSEIRIKRLSNNPLGLVNSLRGMGTGSQTAWWDQLQNLHMPVLLLCGELDVKFCDVAHEMKSLIPHAKLVEFNGVGHAIHVEDPIKFGTIVIKQLLKQNFT
ncbi:2-succinyl-6-hydroxy-2,4-cyclohexadiene-1-carboxylate synthase [Lederbergia citrea]|uniref:2-succinyl-6-hydroxy-2, 4-cyclohexadiene-1-carboxylate synthase n=1 Tax=Lederbergia citrea TaxID=2833581 RepID=UPI001BC9BE65|nr:2-succinyl-6-hydroxy-2,4-cyclohexadiene-1-carboxylate synthase [Lederbergia citrea]MBS4175924.1 2-succinyl-6-hydroxy-2,4-cyclohexadiene-1-carboxylate synthase [Lederbergia citrea]